jgi:hypothetical protein
MKSSSYWLDTFSFTFWEFFFFMPSSISSSHFNMCETSPQPYMYWTYRPLHPPIFVNWQWPLLRYYYTTAHLVWLLLLIRYLVVCVCARPSVVVAGWKVSSKERAMESKEKRERGARQVRAHPLLHPSRGLAPSRCKGTVPLSRFRR